MDILERLISSFIETGSLVDAADICGIPVDEAYRRFSSSPTAREVFEKFKETKHQQLLVKAFNKLDEQISSDDDLVAWRACDSVLKHEAAKIKSKQTHIHIHAILDRIKQACLELPDGDPELEESDTVTEALPSQSIMEVDCTSSAEASLDGQGEH